MIEPLIVEFEVNAPVEHVFRMWTEKTAMWWPVGHSMSGAPNTVEFPTDPGSLIVETGQDGSEHVWGEVVECDPPNRLAFRWHLFFDVSEATDVVMEFVWTGSKTEVTITQTGWERLGEQGQIRRDRTVAGWGAITGPFSNFVVA